jgi:hypothetical protein
MLRVVADGKTSAEMGPAVDELVREAARRMLAAALEAEVDAYVSALADEVDEQGRRLVDPARATDRYSDAKSPIFCAPSGRATGG